MPAARMLIATPETTWSTPKVTVATRVQQATEGAEQHAADQRRGPAPLVAGPAGAPGAEDHHALEADVDHAGAFGEQPAEGGQPDRHGEQQRRGHRRRRGQGLLAADQPDGGQDDERRRPAAPAAGAPAAAGEQRRRSRPRRGRASGVVRTVLMPAPPARSSVDPPGGVVPPGAGPGAGRLRGSPRSAARRATRRATSLATTTASTIVPWMIVTTEAGKSAICSGTSARSRKANSSAARAMPPGLLRPSSATAMPRKPEARGEVGRVGVRPAQQVGHADQAGDRTGQQHRLDHHGAGVHPAGARRRRRQAAGPQVEAEAGAVEQHRDARPRRPRRGSGSRTAAAAGWPGRARRSTR